MKNKVLTIDLNKWCTQQDKARISGIKLTTISQQVKRTKEGKTKTPIEILELPELNGLTLVKRHD